MGADVNAYGFPRDAEKQLERMRNEALNPPPPLTNNAALAALVECAKRLAKNVMDGLFPHPWASALHFAARTNAARIAADQPRRAAVGRDGDAGQPPAHARHRGAGVRLR